MPIYPYSFTSKAQFFFLIVDLKITKQLYGSLSFLLSFSLMITL
jgi:hypothetical protein